MSHILLYCCTLGMQNQRPASWTLNCVFREILYFLTNARHCLLFVPRSNL